MGEQKQFKAMKTAMLSFHTYIGSSRLLGLVWIYCLGLAGVSLAGTIAIENSEIVNKIYRRML